jgi:hypothetical protein
MYRVCESGNAIEVDGPVVGNCGVDYDGGDFERHCRGRRPRRYGEWFGERQDRWPGKAKTVSPRAGRSHYSSVR